MTKPILNWTKSPDRTSWGNSMVVCSIAVGKDNTLDLYIDVEAIDKVPEVLIALAEKLKAEAATNEP